VFDVFEGQLFVALKTTMFPALVADKTEQELAYNVCLAAFLAGGAIGGIGFGILADRWGRRWTLAVTILMYSAFTGLTVLVEEVWQLAVLRFLVGMGVGGEWAVAAAAVAEVFPARARPAASGIFHASSVLGTFLAVGAGLFVEWLGFAGAWRVGFLLGLLPALLVAWVRISMREPESWQAARQKAKKDASRRLGRLTDLFATPQLRWHTLLGTGLAIIGLATFWGTHIRGFDLLENAVITSQAEMPTAARDRDTPGQMRLLGMFLTTLGGGLGLLSFAPISQSLGRRDTFLLFHLAGFAMVLVVCWQAYSVAALLVLLPVFGFFTLGMHAGYAVYFPELFPTRLRGTGAGFCFNTARLVAGPVLIGFAYLQGSPLYLGLPMAMLVLSGLFLVGAVLVLFAPETRGQPLPE
jgi:MFS family permease